MRTVIVGVVVLLALLWLWPNVVHEPLHVAALKLQGSDGHVEFDWMFPIAPVTQRTQPLAGFAGGMAFLLLPSIVSVLILGLTWATRKHAGFITHVILPLYLTYDLVLNVLSYAKPTSDFRFLIALPGWVTTACVLGVAVFGFATIMYGMINSQRNIKKFGEWQLDRWIP